MEAFNDLMKQKNMYQVVLLILIILFLLVPVEIPNGLANMLDSLPAMIAMFILAILSLYYVNPILGAGILVFAFEIIRRVKMQNDTWMDQRFIPSEKKKMNYLEANNEFEVTLEEELVEKMVPVTKHSFMQGNASFKPVYDPIGNASSI